MPPTMTRTHVSGSLVNASLDLDGNEQANGKLEWWERTGGTAQVPTGTLIATFSIGADPYEPADTQSAALGPDLTTNAAAAGTPNYYRILRANNSFHSGGTLADVTAVQIGQELAIRDFPIEPSVVAGMTIVN